eukprot:CAMPEP_0172361342 /NCGR_PEP_ID=MMETSP1060-20121228/5194_1 /TAXON_ID=37318 /ORGANISM="Pseudo-nitzschia pungens, Strain cf. cingulata" /LENGTH=42 /DNA_ID= /DNA_START= /DNA_END= /DNA_ORIENTATION=
MKQMDATIGAPSFFPAALCVLATGGAPLGFDWNSDLLGSASY